MERKFKSILKLSALIGSLAIAGSLVFAGDDDDPEIVGKMIDQKMRNAKDKTLNQGTLVIPRNNNNSQADNNNNALGDQEPRIVYFYISEPWRYYMENPWFYYHQSTNAWHTAEARDNHNNKEVLIVCDSFETPSDYNSFAKYLAAKDYKGIYLFHPVLLANQSKSLTDFAKDFVEFFDKLDNAGTRKRIDIFAKGTSGLIVRYAIENLGLGESLYINNIAFLGTPHEGMPTSILERAYTKRYLHKSPLEFQGIQDAGSSSPFINSLNNNDSSDLSQKINYYTLAGTAFENNNDAFVMASNAHSNVLAAKSASWKNTNSHKKAASIDHDKLADISIRTISNIFNEWIGEWDLERDSSTNYCTNNSTTTTTSASDDQVTTSSKNHTTAAPAAGSKFDGQEKKEELMHQKAVRLSKNCMLFLRGAANARDSEEGVVAHTVPLDQTPFNLIFINDKAFNSLHFNIVLIRSYSETSFEVFPPHIDHGQLYYRNIKGKWAKFTDSVLSSLPHGCPLFAKHEDKYKVAAMANHFLVEQNGEYYDADSSQSEINDIIYISKKAYKEISKFKVLMKEN